MGAPVLWFGVAGLIMENSKFANVVSGGSKLGKVFSWLSIGNDTRKLVNNDMSTSEWAYNTAFNLIGTKATPVGLAYGAGTYIYPRGVRGALADWHHIIYPGWWEYPTHRDFEEKK